jgi:hypothetical protein
MKLFMTEMMWIKNRSKSDFLGHSLLQMLAGQGLCDRILQSLLAENALRALFDAGCPVKFCLFVEHTFLHYTILLCKSCQSSDAIAAMTV